MVYECQKCQYETTVSVLGKAPKPKHQKNIKNEVINQLEMIQSEGKMSQNEVRGVKNEEKV